MKLLRKARLPLTTRFGRTCCAFLSSRSTLNWCAGAISSRHVWKWYFLPSVVCTYMESWDCQWVAFTTAVDEARKPARGYRCTIRDVLDIQSFHRSHTHRLQHIANENVRNVNACFGSTFAVSLSWRGWDSLGCWRSAAFEATSKACIVRVQKMHKSIYKYGCLTSMPMKAVV